MRFALAVLTFLGLAACSRHEASAPDAAPSAPPSRWSGVALAQSIATAPPRADATVVILDARGVRLAGDAEPIAALPARDAWSHGFAATAKRNGTTDLFLVPLHDRIEHVPDGGARKAALLAVAADVPFRPVVEVLFTLGQAEVSDVAFVVASSAGAAEIPLFLPRTGKSKPSPAQKAMLEALQGGAKPDAGPGSAKTAPSDLAQPLKAASELDLVVAVAAEGMSVKAGAGNVAPGCKEIGTGIAIPNAAGVHDYAALTACASSLHALSPAFRDEHEVTVTATSEEPFASIVGVLDALRGASFDRPMLGVPR